MKICCKEFEEFVNHIDDYESVCFQSNIDTENELSFGLAFIKKTGYGKTWHYLNYCPFCANRFEVF